MMVNNLQKYVDLLKKNDLKITPQRLIILKYLNSHHNHPTAEEIYETLKKKNPSLSKTTVYNTLETLTNAGLLYRLTICPTEHRYDINTDMHHHFICKNCGKIYDIHFKCPNVEQIKKKVTSKGHRINEVHGYFKGICKQCLEKKGRVQHE